jgi:hypothetical protein
MATSMCFLPVDKPWPKTKEHSFSVRAVGTTKKYAIKYTGKRTKKERNALIRIDEDKDNVSLE